MMTASRGELFKSLVVLGMHYPEMRWGQLVCFACSLADEVEPTPVEDIQDWRVAEAIELHLAQKRGGQSRPITNGLATLNETRGALIDALGQLVAAIADWSIPKVVSRVAKLAHFSLYDVEDSQLLEAARNPSPGLNWFTHSTDFGQNDSTVKDCRHDGAYACPCCGFRTLRERGGFEICPICYWEDDGQDSEDADAVRGGPNGNISLTQARENYRLSKACDSKYLAHVRPPRPDER